MVDGAVPEVMAEPVEKQEARLPVRTRELKVLQELKDCQDHQESREMFPF
jgi:hypothetical protein